MYKKIIILAVLFITVCVYKVSAVDSFILRILSPNGGENLVVGQNYPITWTFSPNITNVTIGYSGNNGIFGTIASHVGSTGYYNWVVNVGNTIFNNSQVIIWINGYQGTIPSIVASDKSDNSFTVWRQLPTPTPTVRCPPCPKGMFCTDICGNND